MKNLVRGWKHKLGFRGLDEWAKEYINSKGPTYVANYYGTKVRFFMVKLNRITIK